MLFSIFRKQRYDFRKVIVTLKRKHDYMLFLHELHEAKIAVTNLVVQDYEIEFTVALKDLQQIRKIRSHRKVKIAFQYALANPVIVANGLTLFGLFLLWLIPFCCQFFIWGYTIEAEAIEREVEVQNIVQQWTFPIAHSNMQSEHAIRQSLLGNMKGVSWVFVEKAGAKLKLKIEEAPKTTSSSTNSTMSLYAKQAGVITHYFIESGVKAFTLNESVQKGQLLVSAELISGEYTRLIPVRGKVYANFWRTVSFTLPRTISFSTLIERKWKIGLVASNERQVTSYKLLNWLPKQWQLREVDVMENKHLYLSEEHLDSFILPLLKEKTLASLSEDATIPSEKILHVTFDNDTVKGQVLYLVNENIASISPSVEGE